MFDLEDAPVRIKLLPRDRRGYPVPWFVAWIDGEPRFEVMDGHRLQQALRDQRCWVCGGFMRAGDRAFVIGPMCSVNRTSAEPPSHLECAVYSAKHCPFLTNPKQTRLIDVPRIAAAHEEAGVVDPAGSMIRRNPGVALVWVTERGRYHAFPDPGAATASPGVLFNVGEPVAAHWYAQGRAATRAEVMDSIESGFPLLADMAKQDGAEAVIQLYAMREAALEFVPA